MEMNPMPRKRTTRKLEPNVPMINFDFEDRTYQIDTQQRKVYRRFVEIETSKAFEIFSMWRLQNADA
jgi:hypothetical protein